MAAMKGKFFSESGNEYDNFQMLGYIQAQSEESAVTDFISQPQFPIVWGDVEYLWAEELTDKDSNGHFGAYHRIYMDRRQSENPSRFR
tara:strand:+ start:3627 stop:3890 length:264 start_codon:yes stop_codon:yes gene_type:complete